MSRNPLPAESLTLGIDVGSTTVKAVLVDGSGAIAARAYLRHLGDPMGSALRLLAGLADARTRVRPAVTGSGGRALADAWGAPLVHEVSAVVAAVRRRLPAARSIIELGGQDAKLAVIDDHRVHMAMNDRCAAGTGVTIDRCLFRLGKSGAAAAAVAWDASAVRPISSKCGVFAETDLCNLARAGATPRELIISLADAIVVQCLAVLARGETPRPGVVLLGGPLVHLPALAGGWRHHLAALWRQRGVVAGEIVVPENALFFAALGSAELGLTRAPGSQPVSVGELAELLAAAPRISTARLDRPLASEGDELPSPPTLRARAPRARVKAAEVVLGVDAGSTTCKVVALDEDGALVASATCMSTDPVGDARALVAQITTELAGSAVRALGVTGYGAAVLAPVLDADVQVLETVAHARSAHAIAPDAEVVCDVGGQDIKIMVLDRSGAIRDFRLSSQCSAGIGMILEATARELGVPLSDYATRALAARRAPWFGDSCAVFLDANRVTFQRQGFDAGEILAGLARALPRVVWTQVMNGTAPSSLGRVFVLQGGVQRNRAAVVAQVDYLTRVVPHAKVWVHPYPSEAGAIGAALSAADARRDGRPRPATALAAARVSVRSDESTRCRLCPSQCSRTFVEVAQPERPAALHVVGNACAEGTDPSGDPPSKVAHRKRATAPNLLDEEARLFFHPRHAGKPLRPKAARAPLRIGIPRVLSLYRGAPMFRAYLGALGVGDVVYSPVTSEKLWRAGASHGANDPCFPVKVVLAHVHHLLYEVHDAGRRLDAIFLPHFTHAMTPVRHCVDTASCPVIAAAPSLVRAALGEEMARRGIRFLDPMVTVTEPQLLRRQMYEAFGELLGATEEESRHAVRAGVVACAWVDERLEEGAREILLRLERAPDRGAVLVVGRPYHSDPGLNHRVGEELQALGFPVLTVRSIPRSQPADDERLRRLFARELASGAIADPFDVRDLAPEVANSGVAERLFAARFAAHHGRLGVVDLSSFKCGQDSPAYAPVRDLLDRAGVPLCTLHDLDESRPVTSLRLRLRTFCHAMIERGRAPFDVVAR